MSSREAEDSRRRHDRFELLYRVSDAMISTLEPREVLDLILKQAVEILGATSGSLILMDKNDPEILGIEVAHNLDPEMVGKTRLRRGQGVTGRVALAGKPLVIPDVTLDKDYVEIDPRIRSEIAVPLKLADQIIGVINLDSTRVGAFSDADLEILVPLANHAAKVIQNAQLFDSVRQKAEALRLLQSVSQSITGSLDLHEVLRRIVEGAVCLLGAKLCSLFLLSENKEQLVLSTVFGQTERYSRRSEVPVEGSLLGRVIRQSAPLAVANVQIEPLFQQKELAREEGLHALIAVPLLLGSEPIGILAAYFEQIHTPQPTQIELLCALADQSATALQNVRLYERVVQMEDQLHHLDKFSAVGETAAGLAHEIRNPLAVINMLASSLESDFSPEDARRQDVRVIRENIAHIHGLVEELLDVAHYRRSLPQPTDLRPVVESALNLVGLKLSRQMIRVRRRFEEPLPLALVDPGRMEQVLLNLLQNAIDAIGTRGRITLSLKSLPDEQKVLLAVHDTGPGIPAEAYQRLFEPFNTTKERGIGLGLSIVKRIIDEHEGTILVKTSAREGTRFIILLPALRSVSTGESGESSGTNSDCG